VGRIRQLLGLPDPHTTHTTGVSEWDAGPSRAGDARRVRATRRPAIRDPAHVLANADPLRLLADIAFVGVGIGMAAWLVPRQRRQVRRHGGRRTAEVVTTAAIGALIVAIQPDLVSAEVSLVLAIAAVGVAFAPAQVVRLTGGPRVEWQVLAEGTALQRMVARRRSAKVAQHYPDVRQTLSRLAALETPTTARYIEVLRATVFADPDDPATPDLRAELAFEEAQLRRVVGSGPAFEGGLVEVEETPLRPHLLRPLEPAHPPAEADAEAADEAEADAEAADEAEADAEAADETRVDNAEHAEIDRADA
jgi:hypothetical protein